MLYKYSKNNISLRDKKYLPFWGYSIFNIIIILLQFIYSDIFFIYVFNSFSCIIVYFTMENPDIKLVELEKTEKDRALKLSEAKTMFLESMSKELRTPLTSIVGISEDLCSFDIKEYSEDIGEDVQDILNASNTLLEIIGNIIDIGKIESGKLEIIPLGFLRGRSIRNSVIIS